MIMNKYKTWISPLLLLVVACLLVVSCQKKFEEPPVTGAPGVVANTSIKDIKLRYTGGNPVAITDDVIL